MSARRVIQRALDSGRLFDFALEQYERAEAAILVLQAAVDGIERYGEPKYLHFVSGGHWLEDAKAALRHTSRD